MSRWDSRVPDDPRLECLKEHIRKRLKEFCSHLSHEDFAILVNKIAKHEVQLLSAGSTSEHWLRG